MPSNHHSRRHEPPPSPLLQPHSQHNQHHQLHIDTSLASPRAGPARDTAPPALSPSSSNRRQPSPYNLAPTPGTGTAYDASHDPDESFLDNQTPVDTDMADRHLQNVVLPRDSHDLSLSPRNVTRDSLVTNMLLSLDQFSSMNTRNKTPQYDDDNDDDDDDYSPRFFDIPRYRSNNDITAQANNWQERGHGHQYSYSSDFEGTPEDDSSRPSNQYSPGRRSNSSTSPQDPYTKLNGSRPPPSRGNHVRGGRGSKSSSVTSLEQHTYTQPPGSASGSQRWNRGFPRSASFDNAPQQVKPQAYPQLEDVPQSPFRTDFINSFLTDDFDAAPTPTVPGGPRRAPSTPIISSPPPEPKERSSVLRTRSTSRSIKSSSGRSKAANMREPAPPLPSTPAAVDLEPAPAPNVGYGKSKEPQKSASSIATPQPKERPGFFKRVFGGGSSKNTSPATDSSRSSRLPPADQSADSPGSSHKTQPPPTQSKPVSAPPSRGTTSSHSNHPTLQKKSSSFFRRRKKSVVDEAPPVPTQADAPPVPPISVVDKEKFIPMAAPSPVSSLRQVMNPYLNESAASPGTPAAKKASAPADTANTPSEKGEQTSKTEEYKREFSPDYEPSPNARIRKVNSNLDRDRSEQTETPSKRPVPSEARNNSFLDLDAGSDNDELPTPTAPPTSRGNETSESKDVKEPAKDDAQWARKKKSYQTLPIQAVTGSNLALPSDGGKGSGPASPRSIRSNAPSVRINTATDDPSSQGLDSMKNKSLDEPDFVVGEPTEDDRSKAQKIFDGNEDFIQKEKAAAWMGEEGPVRQRTLQAYMELYDFCNQSVVHSLRQVCGRLVFRAETQQVDRILVAFSKRWCACNPDHGFKATGEFETSLPARTRANLIYRRHSHHLLLHHAAEHGPAHGRH